MAFGYTGNISHAILRDKLNDVEWAAKLEQVDDRRCNKFEKRPSVEHFIVTIHNVAIPLENRQLMAQIK